MPAPIRAASPAATSAETTPAPKSTASASRAVRLDGIDQRLRKAARERRIVGHQHPPGAVAAQPAGPAVVDARAGHERRHLAAKLGSLGQHAEAVRSELAVVVMDVTRSFITSPLSARNCDHLLGRVAARILDRDARLPWPPAGTTDAHDAARALRRPGGSRPASAADSRSSGFFLAPMMALIEGSRGVLIASDTETTAGSGASTTS